jgi:histidinol-phosphatase (PHP family)
MASKIGIPVTLGSDAHKPDQVGRHFNEALAMLKQVGYTRITRFRNRKRSEIII